MNDGRKRMKNERWKVHISLISIIVAAVLIGACYYYISEQKQLQNAGGVLVDAGQGAAYGC